MENETERVEKFSWAEYLQNQVVPVVRTNKTKERIAFFSTDLISKLEEHPIPEKAVVVLLKAVFPTTRKYVDRKSRLSVLGFLKKIGEKYPAAMVEGVKTIVGAEVDRLFPASGVTTANIKGTADDRFQLLNWINVAIKTGLQQASNNRMDKFDSTLSKLVDCQARLLFGLCRVGEPVAPGAKSGGSSTIVAGGQEGDGAREGGVEGRKTDIMHQSGLADVRRVIRSNPQAIPAFLEELASGRGKSEMYGSVLLGNVVSTANRLRNSNDGKEAVEAKKDVILKYIETNIVSAKAAVPYSAVDALGEFIGSYVDEAVFKNKMVPVAKRMILRGPEVVFMVLNLVLERVEFDVGPVFKSELADSLVQTVLKSTNVMVRRNGVKLFLRALSKSQNAESLMGITEIILKALSSGKAVGTAADARSSFYEMLRGLAAVGNGDVSKRVIEQVLVQLAKESIETSVVGLIEIIGVHTEVVLICEANGAKDYIETIKKVAEAAGKVVKQQGSKSGVAVKRAWMTQVLGEPVWKVMVGQVRSLEGTEMLGKEAIEVLSKNQDAGFNEVVEGFIGLAIWLKLSQVQKHDEQRAQAIKIVKGEERKGGAVYLYSDKVLHKATEEREAIWLMRALEGIYMEPTVYEGNEWQREKFVEALMTVIEASKRSQCMANEVCAAVNRMVKSNGVEIGSMIEKYGVQQLQKIRQTPLSSTKTKEDGEEEEPQQRGKKTEIGRIYQTFMDGDYDKEQKAQMAMQLALLVHNEENGQEIWISLVQEAGLDVREVSLLYSDKLLERAVDAIVNEQGEQGGSRLLETLSFVLGEEVIETILHRASKLVKESNVKSLGSTEQKIWNTPEGELAADLTELMREDSKSQGGTGSSAERKWEAEVRAQIALKKRGTLGKEEQKKVDEQLKEEKKIREQIGWQARKVGAAIEMIASIVRGNVDEAKNYVTLMYRILLQEIAGEQDGAWLVGQQLRAAVVMIVKQLAEGVNQKHIVALAMAILRTNSKGSYECVDEEWTKEPIEFMVTRLLFSLRMSSETEVFSETDFAIAFPLVQATIQAGGYGEQRIEGADEYTTTSQREEQIAMLAEIILLNWSRPHQRDNRELRVESLQSCLVIMEKFSSNSLAKGIEAVEMICAQTARISEEMQSSVGEERKVVLRGLLSKDSAIRNGCLVGLRYLNFDDIDTGDDIDVAGIEQIAALWIATCDNEQASSLANSELATTLFYTEFELDCYIGQLMEYLISKRGFLMHNVVSGEAGNEWYNNRYIHKSSVKAIAEAVSLLWDSNERDKNELAEFVLVGLKERYRQYYISLEPELDQYGLVIAGTSNKVDPYPVRVAIGETLDLIIPVISNNANSNDGDKMAITHVMDFLLNDKALGDRDEQVRDVMLKLGTTLVKSYGEGSQSSEIGHRLETWLNSTASGAGSDEVHDVMKESVVVLLGTLASYLPEDNGANDGRVKSAIQNLTACLHTPSESVQMAVANCLVPLVKRINTKDEQFVGELIKQLLSELTVGKKYGIRRGAAYGLAGVVKGGGLVVLRNHDIVKKLRNFANDKKSISTRQGALFGVETLSIMLGRLFEPYMIQILPVLLRLFGDSSADVREATSDAAKAIMGQLSGYGVKLVVPSLLNGLSSESPWRTKVGSIEMLGSMAFCAPKQLSSALPAIVPDLVESLSDTHINVSQAAKQALANFGQVIQNPEIIDMVPHLLLALEDPANKTSPALSRLINTAFVHYVDAPSLALIAPVLERGLKERKTIDKRQAAQVFGSLAVLSEPNDLVLYLPKVMPLLIDVLADPVPETRATVAKALGKLVSKLGEERFPTLVDDLLETLQSKVSGMDRAGAAQALSEVVYGIELSTEVDEQVTDDRLTALVDMTLQKGCTSSLFYVREGFMTLLMYLPSTFGDRFVVYLDRVVNPVLRGLADESEHVRSAALKAGQTLVAFYHKDEVARQQLLSELLNGLMNDSWRIRKASVELLGDLLMKVLGHVALGSGLLGSSSQLGNTLFDEDEDNEEEIMNQLSQLGANNTVNNASGLLAQTFGESQRNYIFASLYITRNDVVASVRQASTLVWKALIVNTPRTIKECLEPLVNLVLDALGSASHDRRTSAGLTLGDLVRKLDGGVTDSSHSIIVSKVIPIFGGIISDPLSIPSKRQGVFVGLTEILSTSRVTDYGATITPLIRVGLGDGDQQVREAAVLAFDALQLVLGPKVFDEIVPHLLDALSSEQHEDSRAALDALTQLVSIKPTLLIPVLVPILIKEEPIPIVHIKTLQALLSNSTNSSSVTLLSLLQQQRKLVNILSALFNSYGSSDADQPEYNDAINDILKSISTNCAKDTNGVLIDMFMGFLFDMANSSIKQLSDDLDNNSLSRVTLAFFCIDSIYTNCSQHGFHNMNKYTIEWLNVTLSLLVESSTADMNMSFIPSTLTKLCASIQKPNIAKHAPIFQRTISQSYAQRNSARTKSQRQQTSSESNDTFVHGFTLPKILTPILAIYNYTLLESRTEEHQEKEAAIAGIIDLINYTNPTTLALYVTSGITGPLIRFLSERSNISSSASASTSSSGSTSIMSSSAANAAALEAAANAVRANVIYALSLLLEKTSKNMRPFLPQLQRTFVKFLVVPPASLSNPASSTFAGSISSGESTVKARCQLGLEKLVGLQPRLDPLVTELVNIIRTYLSYPSSALAKSSCVIAVNVLRSILTHVNSSGLTLSDASRLSIEQLFVFGSSDTSSASEEAGETATTTTTTGQRAANLLSLTSSSTSSSSISSPLSGDAHDTDSLQVAVTNILPVIFLSSSSSSSSATTKPTTTTSTASGSAASSSLFKHLKLTTPDDLSSSNTSALTSKLLLNISVLSSLTKTSSTSSATSSNDELLTLIFCNLQLLFTTRYNNSEVVTSIISDDKQFSAFVKSLELFKLYFALKTPTANTAEPANQPSSSSLLETTIKNVFLPSLALSSTTAITTSTSYNALFVQLVNVLKYLAKHTASTTSTPSNVLYDCLPTNLYYEIINSVFDFVRSHHIPLKFASERCLLYLLFLKSNTSTPNPADGAGNRVFDAFVAHCFADELTASSSASVAMGLKKKKKLVVDYYSRVLSKLSVSTEDPDYVDSD